MAKIGDGVPRLIDKAVDFMASSQAFMEYLKKVSASAACTARHSSG
ncbi:Putative cytoplasmic protein [Klebsiella pneumoniae IS39]|nr:Putative cytoplasmic protein [Klebsiella pneumoniae IS39]